MKHFLLLSFSVVTVAANAQSVGYSGGLYSQNFDTLATSGTVTRPFNGGSTASVAGQLWDNGSTVPGWNITFENATNVGINPPVGNNGNWIGAGVLASPSNLLPDFNTKFIRIDAGTNNGGSAYNYGSVAASDRALGALNSGGATSPQRNSIVLVLRNTSAQTFTEFSLKYRGEQWRIGGTRTEGDKLNFSYQIFGAGSFVIDNARPTVASGWIPAASLNFAGPITSGTAAALDGNANFVNVAGSVSNLNWTPGSDLALRWVDFDATGSDDGLAIDDLTIQAVPEPGTMVALGMGVVALLRRRRR